MQSVSTGKQNKKQQQTTQTVLSCPQINVAYDEETVPLAIMFMSVHLNSNWVLTECSFGVKMPQWASTHKKKKKTKKKKKKPNNFR